MNKTKNTHFLSKDNIKTKAEAAPQNSYQLLQFYKQEMAT